MFFANATNLTKRPFLTNAIDQAKFNQQAHQIITAFVNKNLLNEFIVEEEQPKKKTRTLSEHSLLDAQQRLERAMKEAHETLKNIKQ